MSEARGGTSGRSIVAALMAFGSANLALLAVVGVGSMVFVLALALLTGLNPGVAIGLLVIVLAAGAGVFRLWNGHIDVGARQPLGRAIASGLIGFVAVAALIQAVPYGRGHTNPAVVAEPNWDSPRTRELAVRACYDCHSNETSYPWYANVAPFSWAVQQHISTGRRILNFSDWYRARGQAGETVGVVREGEMPPFYYTIAHADARLTDAEVQELATGLRASLGG